MEREGAPHSDPAARLIDYLVSASVEKQLIDAKFAGWSVRTIPPAFTQMQVDYVAANAYLDALAASRSDGLSIHWGIWGDKGMAAPSSAPMP